MSDAALVKVVFYQEYEDGEDPDIETPWAQPLGGDRYRLKNFPFFTYGISYDDIFEALPRDDDDRPYLTAVLEKSGHRTLRLFMDESVRAAPAMQEILDTLSAMGCGIEGDGERFFAINVQPHCDFDAVCAYIDSRDIDWEHADPTYHELFPDAGHDH